jgi:hypothetical protein
MGMNAHVFIIVKDNVQTISHKARVCSLMFDEMSIRRWTALEALRTSEAMAGQAILYIMPLSLCYVVYVKIGSNQWLSV